jgi:transcriptional regulator with XRE-family HTH domain
LSTLFWDIFKIFFINLLHFWDDGCKIKAKEVNEMSTRSERIKLLIEKSGQSYQELEKTTGIKKSSLQRYATGVTTKIPLHVIEKLSKAFSVSQEYLMGWEETKKASSPIEPQLNEGEKLLLDLFRKIPEDKQGLVLNLIRAALGNPEQ